MPLSLKTVEVQIKGDHLKKRFRTVQVYWLGWGDFHSRSRFARSTIPEEKWGLLLVY